MDDCLLTITELVFLLDDRLAVSGFSLLDHRCPVAIAVAILVWFASRPHALAATNPYRDWIAEYAGAAYQEVAAKARAHLEGLADLYATPAREADLVVIFKEATRLEADFWEMGWRAG
jgi:thiaminase